MNQGFYNYQPTHNFNMNPMYSGTYNPNMMYPAKPMTSKPTPTGDGYNNYDDRIGLLAPFLLGGLVGGAVAPAFWGRPYYYPGYYRPYPYPYYY